MADMADATTKRLVFLVDPDQVTDEEIHDILMIADEDRGEEPEAGRLDSMPSR